MMKDRGATKIKGNKSSPLSFLGKHITVPTNAKNHKPKIMDAAVASLISLSLFLDGSDVKLDVLNNPQGDA